MTTRAVPMPQAAADAMHARMALGHIFTTSEMRLICRRVTPLASAANVGRWAAQAIDRAERRGALDRTGNGYRLRHGPAEEQVALLRRLRLAAASTSPGSRGIAGQLVAALPPDPAEGACLAVQACVDILASVAGTCGQPALIAFVAEAALRRVRTAAPSGCESLPP